MSDKKFPPNRVQLTTVMSAPFGAVECTTKP